MSQTKRGNIPYKEVWKQGNKDIRDVIGLGKLIRKGDGPAEIEGLVKTLANLYRCQPTLIKLATNY
jgi:hypothetical protein